MEDINSCNIDKLEKLISQARRIAIVTHMKPDGDAMGSSVAIYHYLNAFAGADAKIVLNDPCPPYLQFLTEGIPASDLIIRQDRPVEAETAVRDSDLLFCLDFNAFHRTDKLEDALKESKADKILIDHHLNPDRECFDLSFSETDISSASELTYQILMETGRIAHDASMLPAASATALMTGMTTDTNNFANSTYPSTFRMASALLAAGVDRDGILANLYNQYGENRLRVLGHMMKDLMTITGDGVAYIILDIPAIEREFPYRIHTVVADSYAAFLECRGHTPYAVHHGILGRQNPKPSVPLYYLNEACSGGVYRDSVHIPFSHKIAQRLVVLLVGSLRAFLF